VDGKSKDKAVQGTSFRKVTRSFNTSGGARREPAKMTVSRTGAIRSNTEGKEMAQEYVRAEGGNPDDFQLAFGGNEDKGQLALYLPKPGDLGVMKVSIYRSSIAFHAGAAFVEHPKLRPVTRVECNVTPTTDAEGVACLVVQIHGATPAPVVKRKKGESDSAKPDKDENKQ